MTLRLYKQASDGLVACLIDGVMAAATLMVMFAYSPVLTGVVALALALYLLLRLKLLQMYRNRSEALILACSEERLTFAETLLGMPNLKLFDPQLKNEQRWVNDYAVVVNAHIELGRAKITYKTLEGLIFGVENIIVIYLAAQMALTGMLTVGMISAFIIYKAQFVQKAVLSVDQAIELRLLSLHLGRMADIALHPLEVEVGQSATYIRRIEGRIELRDLSYRYPGSPSLALVNVNLTVHPQQTVTITGPSGSGKSTLIKIMLGLLPPTSGEVLIDGLPLRNLDILCYRNQIAAVLPNDRLLSGSVSDNICIFNSEFNPDRINRCGIIAGVHDEIMAMPLGYNSLVGPMGNALSDGQKQRILLARALYRGPKVLFLDQGSINLDGQKQQEINENLRRLRITCVNVAYAPKAEGNIYILRPDRSIS